MSQFQVDSAAVTAASGAVRQSAEQLGAEVTAMMRNLLTLQASWQGQAAVSFQQVIQQWQATQNQVKASLEQIQAALAITGRSYEEAESAAIRAFSS